ncbi:MAG TPA: UxaA family hydrolase [Solirubrobacteraceae bacterium]|nr:UxaA family hydrolase [Solirubrobacteraceae bacterium]
MTLPLTGYPRPDGRWGVRNHVLVMPVRSAANLAAERIAQAVPDAVAVCHQSGGDDSRRLRLTLAGFVTNPNVAAVLIVGVTKDDAWLAEFATAAGQQAEFISLAACRGIGSTIDTGTRLAAAAGARARQLERIPMDAEHLVLGLECGGSDSLSGITANPALGVASDRLVHAGGTSILAETPELIGTEVILAQRAVSPEVARRVYEVILGFERAIQKLGIDIRGAQPTPGNQAGGLTTIEEKSLGAAMKGGNAPVAGVIGYAEQPDGHGLHIMDTPGHDIEQMVGMVAGGCQLVAFTTGRGTPTGSPIAPCLKISSNTAMFDRLNGDIDLNAGVILDGQETVQTMGERIYEALLRAASGELTSSERRGNREFAISRIA